VVQLERQAAVGECSWSNDNKSDMEQVVSSGNEGRSDRQGDENQAEILERGPAGNDGEGAGSSRIEGTPLLLPSYRLEMEPNYGGCGKNDQ
jgi:hypothetical protein